MKLHQLALAAALFVSSVQAQNLETTAQNNLNQIGVGQASLRGITGKGVTIGIIDQGFDLTHRDLLGKVTAARNFYTNQAVTSGLHGTAMASVAAGSRNGLGTVGVATDSRLLLAQVGPGGTNTTMSENAVYRALDWLSASGATVINLSFGSAYDTAFTNSVRRNQQGVYLVAPAYGTNYGVSATIVNYYKTATDRGSILVAAAGNQGLAYSEFPGMYATRTDNSGKLLLDGRMIVVGSVDSGNVIANFSNRAGHICQKVNGSVCQDPYLTKNFFVVAPGVNIPVSTGSSSAATLMSGTSPSAAYVSGGVALMRQTWPQLKPEQLVNLLLTTTKDLGAPGVDDVYGRGLVDFDRATRPQGQLSIASTTAKLSGSFTGIPLNGSLAMLPPEIARMFRSTSVVNQAQVVDSYGRNYTADLGLAIIGQKFQNYAPDSPWLGLNGYRQTQLPIAGELSWSLLNSDTGTAVQSEFLTNNFRYRAQIGSMSERSGFLGNYGAGGMGLGSSSTVWTILGVSSPIADDLDLFVEYGQATTSIANSPISMIQVDPTVRSHSWRMGLKQDNFQVSFGIPVSITKGRAQLTGVVGYEYEESGEGYLARPIVKSEQVDLRSPVQEYNIAANYRQVLTKTSVINYNLVQRFNAGGVAGKESAFAGINFTWIQ